MSPSLTLLIYVIKALSYAGALFTSEPEEQEYHTGRSRDVGIRNKTKGSTLLYRAFNESFSSTLPSDEAAVMVSAGRGWVAVLKFLLGISTLRW
jgi:hypothetical protein